MRNLDDPAVLGTVVARLRNLKPESVRQWGTINSQQMVQHLGDVSAAILGQRQFASTTRRPNPVRKFLVMHAIPRLPRGVRSGADPAAKVVDPLAFEGDVDRAVTLLIQLQTSAEQALAGRHPVFGPMNRSNWMRWSWLHCDHHLRQFGV